MSEGPTSHPNTPNTASIVADVLIVKFGDKALAFALDQKAKALDDSVEVWANVVERLSEQSD